MPARNVRLEITVAPCGVGVLRVASVCVTARALGPAELTGRTRSGPDVV